MSAINPFKYLGNIYARGIGRIFGGSIADSLYFDDAGNLVLENSGGVVGFPGGGGVSADLTNPPSTSAVGDAAATGVRATLVSPSDHVHGREAFGTPGASGIGDTASAGVATTVTRSDHVHAREAAGTPVTQAYNDVASAGAAATVARSDHRHGMPAPGGVTFGAVGTSAVGDAASDGVAATVSHSDHQHGREAYGSPGASAVGDTTSAGVATTDARSDHRHAREAFGTVGTSAVGDAAANGTATTVSHSDHIHGREAFAAPSSVAVGVSGSTGTAATLPHSDHIHTVTDVISRGATVLNPSAAINVIVWRAPYACTVTNVRGYADQSGCTFNARRNGASNHLASAATTTANTWVDGGAVQNTAYAAGDRMEIMIVSVTGGPTQFAIQVDLTRP